MPASIRRPSAFTLVAALFAIACTRPMSRPVAVYSAGSVDTASAATPPAASYLRSSWTGPYGGVPAFDKVAAADFEPALEGAMQENLAEIDRIANDPAPPTFANTIEAIERSGRSLERVGSVYRVWFSTMNSPEFQAVEREMAPRLAAFEDKITQNTALFRRIEAVYNAPNKSTALTPEQQRLAWLYYTDFIRAGAELDEAAKARVAAINQQLANLFTRFSQNVLADETDIYLTLNSEAELAGLPQSVKDAAAQAATQKGLPGKWVITNTRSAMDPFLTFSDRRDLREKAFNLFVNRGDNGGERDNNAIITEILKLRSERAKLLGYPTHAHWRLENAMAKTPERAMELMKAVVARRHRPRARRGRRHAGAGEEGGREHHD